MNQLSAAMMVSAAITLLVITLIGVISGRRVKNSADFENGGRRSGGLMVAGALVGTLAGGSSTIGTAQMAFKFGLSAWWFTLGAAFGCLLLGFWLHRPLSASGFNTIQGVIRKEYGQKAGIVTSVLTSLGLILNIVAQILSANALLGAIFGLSPLWCGVITILLMACYVLFGGIRGTSVLGIVKLLLLYIGAVTCGICALKLSGGLPAIHAALAPQGYFDIFSRGFGIDFGSGISACLGIISTQSYVQAVLSAKTPAAAKQGALFSALLTPPIGLLSIFIGYHMRLTFPEMNAAQAFPQFVLTYMPPAFAGVVLATLLIAVVGTGSGMALGFSSIFTNDMYTQFICKKANSRKQLTASRVAILLALVLSLVFAVGGIRSTILSWGFMSMGLRTVVLFLPMCAALYAPGKFSGRCVIASTSLGIAAMIAGSFLPLPFDVLFLGLATCAAGMLAGRLMERKTL